MVEVTLVPVLNDNYAYILQSGNDAAVVDPGDAAPVITLLEQKNLTPDIIFNTHHHGDHIAGNAAIREKYNAIIIGPEKDRHRIPDMDQGLCEGDEFSFGDESIHIMETPGHTSGHICLHFPDSKIIFTGDTLFAMGCGRAFEGTAEQLFDAFARLKKLPDETRIYCGHEYTLDNEKFCLSIDPDNPDLIARMVQVKSLRAKNLPTLPSTIGLEKKTNIFMRAKTAEEFAKFRQLKNSF